MPKHYPTKSPEQVPAAVIQRMVSTLRELHELGQPTNDDEVEERIRQYFRICEQTAIRPGVESLCLALHVSRQTLSNWAHGIGCSERRQQAVQEARALIHSCLEQMALNGRLSPPTAIFLMKNWMHYSDGPTVIETASRQQQAMQPHYTPQEIQEIIDVEGISDDTAEIDGSGTISGTDTDQ